MQTHKSTYTLTSQIKLKSILMDLIWLKVLRNSCRVPYLFGIQISRNARQVNGNISNENHIPCVYVTVIVPWLRGEASSLISVMSGPRMVAVPGLVSVPSRAISSVFLAISSALPTPFSFRTRRNLMLHCSSLRTQFGFIPIWRHLWNLQSKVSDKLKFY